MNHSPRWHTDVASSLTIFKATLLASQRPSFEMARNDEHENIPISTWEETLNKECALTPAVVATKDHEEANVEVENCQIKNCRTNEKDPIGQEAKSTVRDSVMNELLTMVRESLEDIPRTSFHTAQSGVRSVYITSLSTSCWNFYPKK